MSRIAFSSVRLLGVCLLAAAALSYAQTPSAATPPATKHRAHRPASKKKTPDPQPLAPVVEVRPPDPPDWPANAKPQPAIVGWDGSELHITAANSSLDQILRQVSVITGVKVEGLGGDQRIFGSYGPAPTRDVLSSLLDGSGYNVMMVGDSGQGTPRQLLLTSKNRTAVSGAQQAGQVNQASEDDADEPDPPEPPDNIMRRVPGMIAPQQGPPRTSQQFMQDIQQRRVQQLHEQRQQEIEQQQLQLQQQQQDQQGTPLSPPPQ